MNNPYDPRFEVPSQTPTPARGAQGGSNGLGIAGFVISIIGVFTCGCLSPVGLLLSLIAMLRPPRGFAFAGVAVGLVGMPLFAFWGYVVVLVIDESNTKESMQVAVSRIDQYESQNGELPEGPEGNELIVDIVDAWDNSVRYDFDADSYKLRSAGPDGKFDNDDDIVYDSVYGDFEEDDSKEDNFDWDDDEAADDADTDEEAVEEDSDAELFE